MSCYTDWARITKKPEFNIREIEKNGHRIPVIEQIIIEKTVLQAGAFQTLR